MLLLELSNCEQYLRDSGLVAANENIGVSVLAGGVSNMVFHVRREQGDDFVLKQAREQLRVEEPWFCSVERIWREVEVLRVCHAVLDAPRIENVSIPQVFFEDRDNYVFAMTAAPTDHATWKQQLMGGQFDHDTAAACGELLGRLHAGTWCNGEVAQRLADRQFFLDLRVAPYYEHVAQVHADLRPDLAALIASLEENRLCLVHGDFSPKNLLVWDAPSPHVMLIDCEVGHCGDPAFDLGFFLSHLLLKSVHWRWQTPAHAARPLELARAFWVSYGQTLSRVVSSADYDLLQQRAVKNLAGCLLARIDGKSPVEYLTQDNQQDFVRRMSRTLFSRDFSDMTEAFDETAELILAAHP